MKITIEAINEGIGVKISLNVEKGTKGGAVKNYLCIIQTCLYELAEIMDKEDHSLLLDLLLNAVKER